MRTRSFLKFVALAVSIVGTLLSGYSKDFTEREPNGYVLDPDPFKPGTGWVDQNLGTLAGGNTISGTISGTGMGSYDLFRFIPSASGKSTVSMSGIPSGELYDCCYFGTAGCSFQYAMSTTRFILRSFSGASPCVFNAQAGCTYFIRVTSSTVGKAYKINLSLPGTAPAPTPTPTPKPKTCKVTLVRNDGAGTLVTRTCNRGASYHLPTIASLKWARRGYDFAGWASDTASASAGRISTYDGGSVYPSDSQVALDRIAVWRLKPGYYQIRFNKNDGTGKWRSVACEYGVKTVLPSCGSAGLGWSRSGYVFCGWATSAAKAAVGEIWRDDRGVTTTPVAAGKTLGLYAIWRKPSEIYGIRFIRNDGAGTLRTLHFSYGFYTGLPTIASLGWARRGYDFLGWSSNPEDATSGSIWLFDGDYVAYDVPAGTTADAIASWRLKSGHYQIRFNKNDGTGKWRTLAYEYGKSTALPTCANGLGWSRPGYVFAGWATSVAKACYGDTWRGDGETVRTAIGEGKTLSVYAVWE